MVVAKNPPDTIRTRNPIQLLQAVVVFIVVAAAMVSIGKGTLLCVIGRELHSSTVLDETKKVLLSSRTVLQVSHTYSSLLE